MQKRPVNFYDAIDDGRHYIVPAVRGGAQAQATAEVMPGPKTAGGGGKGVVAFRRATAERVSKLPNDIKVLTASTQRVEHDVEGSGFVYGILLDVTTTAGASQAATVAFWEDGPYSFLNSVVYRDVNGELVNLGGWDLYAANLGIKQYVGQWEDAASNGTSLYTAVTGSGATGGNFSFLLRVPIALNRRDLIALVGNQDRSQKYSLRTDYESGAASATGPIYTTAPTNFATATVDRYYENYSVPLPTGANGQAQEVLPPSFGTLHFLTSFFSEAVPSGGNTVNHFLRRIGNTIRFVIIALRSNSSRVTADTNAPTSIIFKVGEDTLFTESYRYRRWLMFERFGFDWPKAVLIYEALHDFDGQGAGGELGDDYFHTQSLVNAQFLISYPAGFGSTANSLKFITDDLIYVPAGGMR